jgi:hypothetical protein
LNSEQLRLQRANTWSQQNNERQWWHAWSWQHFSFANNCKQKRVSEKSWDETDKEREREERLRESRGERRRQPEREREDMIRERRGETKTARERERRSLLNLLISETECDERLHGPPEVLWLINLIKMTHASIRAPTSVTTKECNQDKDDRH